MMIWSALHGNMQLPKRAASELASRREHMVKRACFKWGIGRCLYTAPRIWVPKEKCNIKVGRNNNRVCYDRFTVEKIKVEEGRIVGLAIKNETKGCRAFMLVPEKKEGDENC